MATNLYETVSSVTEPGLLAGNEGKEIKVGVMLAAAQGVLPRGRVIKEDTTSSKWVSVSSAPTASDRLAVLGATTDTGEPGTTEDQCVVAYLSGLFNREAIHFGEDVELTGTYEEILRGKGIFMDCVVPTDGPVPEYV